MGPRGLLWGAACRGSTHLDARLLQGWWCGELKASHNQRLERILPSFACAASWDLSLGLAGSP